MQPLTPEQRQLVEQHVEYARRVAYNEHKKANHIDPEEMVSWAYQGLVQAAQRFSPQGGAKFKTFATFRIRGAITDQLRHESERFVSRRDYRNGKRNTPVSLDALTEDGWDLAAGGLDITESIALHDAMKTALTDRERIVITDLAAGMQGTDIAEKIGVTSSRVSQIASGARTKLREAMTA